MKESTFLRIFGKKNNLKVIDFFLENNVFSYTVPEIDESLKLDLNLTANTIKILEYYGLVVNNNERLKLNLNNEIVKKLIEIDNLLTRKTADEAIK